MTESKIDLSAAPSASFQLEAEKEQAPEAPRKMQKPFKMLIPRNLFLDPRTLGRVFWNDYLHPRAGEY